MKKVISCFLMLCLLLTFPCFVYADSSIAIALYINGKKVSGTTGIKVIGNYSYIPVNAVDGIFKVKTSWDNSRKKATIIKDKIKIEMVVDSTKASVNGKSMEMEASPRIVGKETVLPLRFIGVQFGYKVSWDKLTRAVYMFNSSNSGETVAIPAPGGTEGTKNGGTQGDGSQPGGNSRTDNPAGGDPDISGNPVTYPTDKGTTVPASGQGLIPNSSSGNQSGGLPAVSSIQATANQVVIQTDGNVQPKSFTLTNPDRIVVDIPNSRINPSLTGGVPANNGEIAVQHPLINKIRYSMFSKAPSTVRVVVDLKRQVPYNVSADSQANQVVVQLQTDNSSQTPVVQPSTPGPRIPFKVVIDAGHGGNDPGASGVSKTYEKWLNLSLAAKVNALLLKETAIQPFMTRTDDTFISLDDRVNFANNMNADLFISIHANVVDSPSVRGTETYYSRPESKALADVIHRSFVSLTGLPDRKVRQQDYRVIKSTKMPAVLLEVGYLTNAQDESQMLKDDFQMLEALAIVAGIKQYLQIK